MKIYPVILSGGSGSRLWPLSREHYPKQLLSLVGERTLLQDTLLRLDGLSDIAQPLIVCNEEHRFLVAEQCRQLDCEPLDIILEPIGRNTAPALTIAALYIQQIEPDALLLVMPADHLIQDIQSFQLAVVTAATLATDGKLVTFGITPLRPETGYGYIKQGEGNAVEAFVEKPDQITAESYLASGEYLWNSGMFLLSAGTWMREIHRLEPDMEQACISALDKGKLDGDFRRLHKESFTEAPSDSIDYAVMEKTQHAAVVPMDAGWSDIGAWSSLWAVTPRDRDNNAVQGDVYTYDTHHSMILSNHRLVATIGLDNMIIVETSDAVLVADKDRAQDVKLVVDRLKTEQRGEHLHHRRVHRPWGHYESVDDDSRFQVKRITVKPGASLSLQMHHHRAEHWVVVKGTAKVTRGDESIMLSENQSTYIPIGMKHRLENPGTIALEIIEVQSGSYLGEDDIVRFDDIYNRTSTE